MSLFIPEPVRQLLADALERVPRPLDREVIGRTFQAIEKNPDLLARYRSISAELTTWTVNKFGGMAVRVLLGWDKEESNPRPAIRFTTLVKTYSRLVPPPELRHSLREAGTAEAEEPSTESDQFAGIDEFPEIRDWVTPSQAADMLGITRAGLHKKLMQRDFQSVHRLGDRPYLVLLRSEVERMKVMRQSAQAAEEPGPAASIVSGNEAKPGKSTIAQFLERCNPKDREYFEKLFACLDKAGIEYWMGEKGFSVSRVFRGYPTLDSRLHGLHLRMDHVPNDKKGLVREMVATASGHPQESIRDDGATIFASGELPASAVCDAAKAALA